MCWFGWLREVRLAVIAGPQPRRPRTDAAGERTNSRAHDVLSNSGICSHDGLTHMNEKLTLNDVLAADSGDPGCEAELGSSPGTSRSSWPGRTPPPTFPGSRHTCARVPRAGPIMMGFSRQPASCPERHGLHQPGSPRSSLGTTQQDDGGTAGRGRPPLAGVVDESQRVRMSLLGRDHKAHAVGTSARNRAPVYFIEIGSM